MVSFILVTATLLLLAKRTGLGATLGTKLLNLIVRKMSLNISFLL